jgi:hypothetical protein
VPPEIPFEHLYGLSWNPSVMAGSLRAIDGLAEASTVGIDAWSPGFARAIARIAPSAGVVPADDLLQSVRAIKLDAEVDRIRAAVAVAAAGVAAAIDARAAGAGEPAALGAALEEMARLGCTIPSSEPIVHGGVVDIGVLHDGYEGGVGRTAGAQSGAADDAHRAVVAACRAGASGDDLRKAAGGADVQVRGSGMGFEPPVIRAGLGGEVRLLAGMVLSVSVAVDGAHRRDLVLVGEAQSTAF